MKQVTKSDKIVHFFKFTILSLFKKMEKSAKYVNIYKINAVYQ